MVFHKRRQTLVGLKLGAKAVTTTVVTETVVETVAKELPVATLHKHHVFPREFKSWFLSKGINIDDYCLELLRTVHLKGIHGKGYLKMKGKWNAKWAKFIAENPNADASQIFHFAEGLIQDYGLSGLPYIKY